MGRPKGEVMRHVTPRPLTPRQLEVLRLVVGKTNTEIGAELGVIVQVVSKHIDAIYGRLRLGDDVTRAGLAELAVQQGLVKE